MTTELNTTVISLVNIEGQHSCNINLKVSKKLVVIFHNLRGYDSHLIFKELGKFNCSVSVIPNGLEKYMSFTLGKNIVFIDSMFFLNSSLDKLVKTLSDEDFKYLSSVFSGKKLDLVKKNLLMTKLVNDKKNIRKLLTRLILCHKR